MSGVFEQLKTLEVKIQATQADVEQSLKQDQTCKEGLEEVQKRIDECKAGDVVFMKKYVAARKDFDTVRDFSEQSRAHTTILQSALGVLERARSCYRHNMTNWGRS